MSWRAGNRNESGASSETASTSSALAWRSQRWLPKPSHSRSRYPLVWWFRSSLHLCRKPFKRTSEPDPHQNHNLLCPFESEVRNGSRRRDGELRTRDTGVDVGEIIVRPVGTEVRLMGAQHSQLESCRRAGAERHESFMGAAIVRCWSYNLFVPSMTSQGGMSPKLCLRCSMNRRSLRGTCRFVG